MVRGLKRSGSDLTVAEQLAHVEGSLVRAGSEAQRAFSLAIAERMLAVSKVLFPLGLPTRVIAYSGIDRAFDLLWNSSPSSDAISDLLTTSTAWLPLTSDGRVDSSEGAGLGYYVGASVRHLAEVAPWVPRRLSTFE